MRSATCSALSAQALGIASERCLRDYFRLDPADSKARLAELVEAGDSFRSPSRAGTHRPISTLPQGVPAGSRHRRCSRRSIRSVWERSRAERLFDFRYRIEIYTPVEKREFGYYCLPFLFGDSIVARVDLKADRAAGAIDRALDPSGSSATPPDTFTAALSDELRRMAAWLGLTDMAVPKPWAKRLGF